MRLLVHGGRVLLGAARTPEPVDLVIDDGTIVEVCSRASSPNGVPPAERLDASDRVVLPGLVNAHTHSYAQLGRRLVADTWLEPWMVCTAAMWRHATAQDAAIAAALQVRDALRNGVTTIVDHATLDAAAAEAVIDAYASSGARVTLAVQVADLPVAQWHPPVGASVDDRVRAADTSASRTAEDALDVVDIVRRRVAAHPRLEMLVGPAAPERCSPTLLAALAHYATVHGVGVHTHLLEVPTQRLHDDLVGRLDVHGLLGPATTVVHGAHLDDDDRHRLAAAGAALVHCPMSNMLLGGATADIPSARTAGVTVGLGSDGWNCGGASDLAVVARVAMAASRPGREPDAWLTAADTFAMLTSALAFHIGWPGLGVLDVGAPADFLVVDPVAAGWIDGVPVDDQLVWGGFGAGLESVWVDGKCAARHGRPTSVPLAALAGRAAERIEALTRASADSRAVGELDLVPALHDVRRRADERLAGVWVGAR